MLSMQSEYTMETFPHEWQTYAGRREGHNQHPTTVSFGSGTSTAGSLRSGLSTNAGNSRGTDSIQSGGDKIKDAQKDPNKQHSERHPDRYSKNAKKTAVQEDIRETLAGMGNTPFVKILDTNNKSHFHLRGNNSYSQGICQAFATALCTYPNCRTANLVGQAIPQARTKWLRKEIEPGCIRIKSGEDIQPRKKSEDSVAPNRMIPHTASYQSHLRYQSCGGYKWENRN